MDNERDRDLLRIATVGNRKEFLSHSLDSSYPPQHSRSISQLKTMVHDYNLVSNNVRYVSRHGAQVSDRSVRFAQSATSVPVENRIIPLPQTVFAAPVHGTGQAFNVRCPARCKLWNYPVIFVSCDEPSSEIKRTNRSTEIKRLNRERDSKSPAHYSTSTVLNIRSCD